MGNEVKKEKDLKVFIIGILTIIVAGLIGFIVYDKILNNKNDKQIENAINNSGSDQKLYVTYEEAEEISKEFDTIMDSSGVSFNTMLFHSDNHIFNRELFASLDLSKETKNEIALNGTKNTPVSEKNKSSKVFRDLVKEYNGYYDGFNEISGEEVKKIHNNLFGKDIEHKDINGCPMYYYDLENNVYYAISECGGESPNEIISYKYDYIKENKNTISFKLALALKIYEGEVCNPEFYGSVDSYDKKTYYESKCGKIIAQEGYSFKLNESNKDKFTNYKITFKNVDGNYVFDKIEKI